MESKIDIFVRLRPASDTETPGGAKIIKSKVLVRDKTFKFDTIFNEQAEQDEIFEAVAVPLLDKFYSGFSCTVFAYG